MDMENKLKTYKRRDPVTVKNKKLVKSNGIVNWYEDETGELLVEFKYKPTLEEAAGIIELDHEINSVELIKGRL